MATVRYGNEVLDPTARLYAAALGSAFFFMDDSARPQTALYRRQLPRERRDFVYDVTGVLARPYPH